MGFVDMRFSFDEVSHTYRLGDRVLPSVTQIIGPLTDWSKVPADVLDRKRAFGSAVHLACELDDAGELDEAATHPEVMQRVVAWRQYLAAAHARVLFCEGQLRTHHPRLGFAGTPDRVVRVEDEHWLIDLKTSDLASRTWGVQLAGYQLLLENHSGLPIHRRASVRLKDDGDFRVDVFRNPNDELCFRACLAVHQWKESTQ